MSTPSLDVHRAVVHSSDPVTGYSLVKVPSLLGAGEVIEIPPTGLSYQDGMWNVPREGESRMIAVTPDRMQYFWMVGAENNGSDPGGEPIGHEDRTKSRMSFDNATRTFTITPAQDFYSVWCVGRKYDKYISESVTIPNETGLYYIYFDTAGQLQYRAGYFDWGQDTPTAYVYWNTHTQKAEFFADERHGITMDWQTHEYLHRTRGAAIANGFDASNFDVSTNDGNTDEQAQLDISNGTFFDEDLQVDIEHSLTPEDNTWQQQLQGPARIPVFYRSGTGWVEDNPTDFPVKKVTLHPGYNSNVGGNWSVTELGANTYGIQWIVATNQLNYPVLSIMGQQQYANVGQAEAASWADMDLDGLPIVEIRVLYKIIFRATGSNTPGCYFDQIDDYRNALSNATSTAAAVVDHGNLTGLADNDHPQYAVAGSTGSIQYNGGGSFAGGSFLAWDSVDAILYGGNEVRAASVAGVDSGIVLGQTYSASYVGMRTGGMSATSNNEYVIMSNGTNTYVSTGLNGVLYLRPYANDTASQIVVDSNLTTLSAQTTYVAGSLGVGESTPSYTLDVAGTGRFTTDLYVNGTLVTDVIRNDNGNSIGIEGGDTWNLGANMSGEYVWLAAESGVMIVSSDSNSTNWADREQVRITATGGIDVALKVYGHIYPGANNTNDLGSTSLRWRNIYTQDLHLSNGIGDYTIVEGEEDLYLKNHKTGKSFKFALIEVDESEVPPVQEVS